MEQCLGLTGELFSIGQTAQLEQVCNFINVRMARKWDDRPWPELLNYQERAFAAPYVASRDYAAGDMVWYATTEKYYAASQDSTGNAPTNVTFWAETSRPAALTVEHEQYGLDKISKVWGVWSKDPRVNTTALDLGFIQTGDGFVVPAAPGNTVWVVFAKPASRYTAVQFSQTAADAGEYSRYDLTFWPAEEDSDIFPDRGDVFMAEVNEADEYVWQLVPFPAFMAGYIGIGVAADLMRYRGQKEQAAQFDAQAEDALEDEWDKVRPAGRAQVTGVGG